MQKTASEMDQNKVMLADMLGTSSGMTAEQKQQIEKTNEHYNSMSEQYRHAHKDDLNVLLRIIKKIIQL